MRPSSLHLRSIGASRLAASSCRPISFFAPAEKAKETNKELSERLFVQVKSLHESTLQPLNQRWLGPLEKAGSELIPLPMVFVLGNHSSGKSTFLNHVVGRKIQESGVAPTDDGFTIIARGTRDVDQDGPALVGDKDLGFGGLRSFGTAFVNHLSLKLRTDLAIDGIAMVDTPGMIDSPLTASSSSSFTSSSTDFSALGARVIAGGSSGSGSGADSKATQMLSSERGYDFQGVVRWFAQRADLILLFFDPEKPGTTGETLSILTSSLVGEENKLIFVLNKADTFARTHDFARAYGALSWNLSKVIPRKDLPRIATMRVPIGKGKADDAAAGTAANAGFLKDTLPDLDATLQEIIGEVHRTPLRRVDNLISRAYDSARLLRMHATVLQAVKKEYQREMMKTIGGVATVAASLGGLSATLMMMGAVEVGAPLAGLTVIGSAAGSFFAQKHLARVADRLIEGSGLDEAFRRTHFLQLAEGDAFTAQLWERTRNPLRTALRTLGIKGIPTPKRSELQAIDDIVNKAIPELRKAATKAGAFFVSPSPSPLSPSPSPSSSANANASAQPSSSSSSSAPSATASVSSPAAAPGSASST